MSKTDKLAFQMTAGHRTDLKATAQKLAASHPNKYTDEHGHQWVGFTYVDFMRVMKLVAGVHVALETIDTLEARVKELEAWQSEYAGLVCAHSMTLPPGLSAVEFTVADVIAIKEAE